MTMEAKNLLTYSYSKSDSAVSRRLDIKPLPAEASRFLKSAGTADIDCAT